MTELTSASTATLDHIPDIWVERGNYGWSSRFGWLKDRFGVAWQLDAAPQS